jgi:hypothetical protein
MNADEKLALTIAENVGAAAERKRIIALLETDATTGTGTKYCTLPLDEEHCHWCFEIVRLIALIKGDDK